MAQVEKDSHSLIKGFDASSGSGKERYSFLSSLREFDAPPPVLDVSNLVCSLKPVVIACFMDGQEPAPEKKERSSDGDDANEDTEYSRADEEEAKARAFQAFLNNTNDADWFSDLIRRQETNLVSAARDIGTHTAKIPNAAVQGPSGLFPSLRLLEEASGGDFMSSFTICADRKVGAAGDASRTRSYRLLAMRFMVDGEVVALADDIRRDGLISRALIELGFSPQVIAEIRSIISTECDLEGGVDQVDGAAKVLMWPLGDDDYVGITPVHSYAMHIEITKRLKKIRAAEGWIKTRDINVGGSKPQNAGLVNSALGGRHPHLTGYPPEIPTEGATLVWMIRKGHDILVSDTPQTREVAVKFAEVAKDDDWNNDRARVVLRDCIESMTEDCLGNVLELRTLVDSDAWGPMLTPMIEELPAWMVATVNGALIDQSADVIDDAAEHVTATIITMIGTARNGEANGVDADTALRSLVKRTVSDFIVTL